VVFIVPASPWLPAPVSVASDASRAPPSPRVLCLPKPSETEAASSVPDSFAHPNEETAKAAIVTQRSWFMSTSQRGSSQGSCPTASSSSGFFSSRPQFQPTAQRRDVVPRVQRSSSRDKRATLRHRRPDVTGNRGSLKTKTEGRRK